MQALTRRGVFCFMQIWCVCVRSAAGTGPAERPGGDGDDSPETALHLTGFRKDPLADLLLQTSRCLIIRMITWLHKLWSAVRNWSGFRLEFLRAESPQPLLFILYSDHVNWTCSAWTENYYYYWLLIVDQGQKSHLINDKSRKISAGYCNSYRFVFCRFFPNMKQWNNVNNEY